MSQENTYKLITNILIVILSCIASVALTIFVVKSQEVTNNRVSIATVNEKISTLNIKADNIYQLVERNIAAQAEDIARLKEDIAALKSSVRGYANKTGRIRNVQEELLKRFDKLEKAFYNRASNTN